MDIGRSCHVKCEVVCAKITRVTLYIDIRQILDNLYYDTDSFLKGIKKVEVQYE